jgi:hypothetical protein
LSKKTNSPEEYASDLLSPTVALFKSLGLDLREIQQIVAYAYNKVGNFKGYKKIERSSGIADAINSDIVSKWIRSINFLDKQGQPKILALKGKNSFYSLVRAVDPNCDPLHVLNILMRYKTVEKVNGKNNYKLKVPFYKSDSGDHILINTATSFLWDANKTIFHLLKRRLNKGREDPFWFRVKVDNLAKKDIEKFMAFMRERVMLFLYEADDWLEAHRAKGRVGGGRTVKRVGLGIFSFANDFLDLDKIKNPR